MYLCIHFFHLYYIIIICLRTSAPDTKFVKQNGSNNSDIQELEHTYIIGVAQSFITDIHNIKIEWQLATCTGSRYRHDMDIAE
jgi:hypothetical protein